MVTINPKLWDQLEGRRPAAGEYEARQPEPSVDFYVAVGRDGFRHLLLGVPSDKDWMQDDKSRGLVVRGKSLQVHGEPIRPFLLATCTDRNGHEAFDLVAKEILDRLVSGESPTKALSVTLERWRRFWGNALHGALSDEVVRGIFGELWFLSVWLLPRRVGQVVHWVGPTGTRHDFQWSDKAVEVKTTLSTRGHVHQINGVDQLETPEFGPLYLFSLRLRAEPGSANSLVSLIRKVQGQLADNPEALTLFESRLVDVGYSPAHDHLYDQLRLRVVEERLYQVGEGFPRIIPGTFPAGIPSGVEAVTYTINLETAGRFCVAQSPSVGWLPPP
jgi:hypothetical protein